MPRVAKFKELSFIRHSLMLLLAALVGLALAHHQGIGEALLAKVRDKYGSPAENRLRRWQDLIHDNLDKTDREKLEIVNDFFNGALFVDDIVFWKKRDYWATPMEFLIHDAGDCEDFSIAKYFTLREMGVNIRHLRLTYVKALTLNRAHMVLAYYSSARAEPLILDNINKRIRPASQRSDLFPVYSFNGESLWLARTRNEQLKAGNPGQIKLWTELNERMSAQNYKPERTKTQAVYRAAKKIDRQIVPTSSRPVQQKSEIPEKKNEPRFYPGVSLLPAPIEMIPAEQRCNPIARIAIHDRNNQQFSPLPVPCSGNLFALLDSRTTE